MGPEGCKVVFPSGPQGQAKGSGNLLPLHSLPNELYDCVLFLSFLPFVEISRLQAATNERRKDRDTVQEFIHELIRLVTVRSRGTR
jgi:hypothetical protein